MSVKKVTDMAGIHRGHGTVRDTRRARVARGVEYVIKSSTYPQRTGRNLSKVREGVWTGFRLLDDTPLWHYTDLPKFLCMLTNSVGFERPTSAAPARATWSHRESRPTITQGVARSASYPHQRTERRRVCHPYLGEERVRSGAS